MMTIESGFDFAIAIAALAAAAWGFFRLARPAVRRRTKRIVNRKWRRQ
jgi:hypothetical protein